MKKPSIIFVCGELCSGKSTVAKSLFIEATRVPNKHTLFIEVSDVVSNILQSKVRSEISNRPELDQEIIANIKSKMVGGLDQIIVSGVRQVSILKAFSEASYIWASSPYEERYRRFCLRNTEKDPIKSIEAFKESNQKDVDLGILEVKIHIFSQI